MLTVEKLSRRPETFRCLTGIEVSLFNEIVEMIRFPFAFTSPPDLSKNRSWQSSLFEIPKKEEEMKKWKVQQNYAEYIYFHDYVRSFLLSQNLQNKKTRDNSVRFWKYQLPETTLIRLEYCDPENRNINKTAFLEALGGIGYGRVCFESEKICYLDQHNFQQWMQDAVQTGHAGYRALPQLSESDWQTCIEKFKNSFLPLISKEAV